MKRILRALRRFWTHHHAYVYRDWAHVPAPMWACKRGTGLDYW